MRLTDRPIAISLFSGAGGLDIGFERAGFNILAAVESDPSCCSTLRQNFKQTLVIENDVRAVSGTEILSKLNLRKGDLDVVYGGPPCQPFSLAGLRKGLEDERGKLLGEFVRLVDELQPKAFLMEKVNGMANWSKGEALSYIVEEFLRLNYQVSHSILNAANFGVPQFRERLFVVGTKKDLKFYFPMPTHSKNGETPRTKPFATVKDALMGLPIADRPSAAALRVSKTIAGRIAKHGY